MRILLADAQTKVRFALRVLLERQPGFEVVGEAAGAEGVLAHAAGSCPDVVLLDWSVVGAAADDLMLALRSSCPGVGVIVLSGRPEVREAALAAGADAFVSKGNPPEHLLAAIAGCCRDGKAEAIGRGAFRDAPAATSLAWKE
ncbi:MAG: response regulator transcription factor [Anaerolineae bacterium]|nr:response regulator transcription factor [Anaerolineae bacterium]